MKIIFYIFTVYPLRFAFLVLDIAFKVMPVRALKPLSPFRVTRKNLSIAFADLDDQALDLLAKESYKETLKSIYETLYTWSRSHQKIIYQTKRINNRFLFNNPDQEEGLIICGLHNRSIDFMLRWISSQRSHTSLYKKIKSKLLNSFVKKFREEGSCKMVETGIGGVKSILASLENNQMTCMASDQVPARGLGVSPSFLAMSVIHLHLLQSLQRNLTNKFFCHIFPTKKILATLLILRNLAMRFILIMALML